jgi:predicted NUDIX family NTP pyrophosphohydrolase
MPRRSAGILLYRERAARSTDGAEMPGAEAREQAIEVLLVHPGGPFWARKDAGAWSIPKGEYDAAEEPLAAARREFAEETGMRLEGEALALGAFRQSSAKIVDVWAIEGDFDPATLKSNTFALEWPPRSGRIREVPEVDRAAWFTPEEARIKLIAGQRPILDALLRHLHEG